MAEDEFVAEWFRFANMDLDTAKHTFETMRPAPLEIICYHCQQSAEKFMKALQIHFGEEVEKTHDLVRLVNSLRKYTEIPENFPHLLNTLTQFATKTRYPQQINLDEALTRRGGECTRTQEMPCGKTAFPKCRLTR